MPKKKIHQSGKFSTKSGKISTSAECSNSCDFGIKNFFLEVENFPLKWKKIQLPLFGIKLGVLVCPDEPKIFSQSGKFSTKSGHEWWMMNNDDDDEEKKFLWFCWHLAHL